MVSHAFTADTLPIIANETVQSRMLLNATLALTKLCHESLALSRELNFVAMGDWAQYPDAVLPTQSVVQERKKVSPTKKNQKGNPLSSAAPANLRKSHIRCLPSDIRCIPTVSRMIAGLSCLTPLCISHFGTTHQQLFVNSHKISTLD